MAPCFSQSLPSLKPVASMISSKWGWEGPFLGVLSWRCQRNACGPHSRCKRGFVPGGRHWCGVCGAKIRALLLCLEAKILKMCRFLGAAGGHSSQCWLRAAGMKQSLLQARLTPGLLRAGCLVLGCSPEGIGDHCGARDEEEKSKHGDVKLLAQAQQRNL